MVLNAPGPPPSTMVLPEPLDDPWTTLILLGPLRVTTLRKSRSKVDQGGPGGPRGPWSWVVDQEHCGPTFTFCWCLTWTPEGQGMSQLATPAGYGTGLHMWDRRSSHWSTPQILGSTSPVFFCRWNSYQISPQRSGVQGTGRLFPTSSSWSVVIHYFKISQSVILIS